MQNNVYSLTHLYAKMSEYQPPKNLFQTQHKREAAVLVPILKDNTPELLFTLRSNNLSLHAGQISFPGGMKEKDDKNLLHTALREVEEEISLAKNAIEIIGELSPIHSSYGVQVTPFIGFIDKDSNLKGNPDEVAKIFTVPLHYFIETPCNIVEIQGSHGKTLSLPSFQYKQYTIWGMTAMMVVELIKILIKTS